MALPKLKIGLFLALLLGVGANIVRFKNFVRTMFERQVERAAQRADCAEYAWGIRERDSRTAHPLSQLKLGGLGVFG